MRRKARKTLPQQSCEGKKATRTKEDSHAGEDQENAKKQTRRRELRKQHTMYLLATRGTTNVWAMRSCAGRPDQDTYPGRCPSQALAPVQASQHGGAERRECCTS